MGRIIDFLDNINLYDEKHDIYISFPVDINSNILIEKYNSVLPSEYILAGLDVFESKALLELYRILNYSINDIANFFIFYITNKVYFLDKISLKNSLHLLKYFQKDSDIICAQKPWLPDSNIIIYTGQYDKPTTLQQKINNDGYSYLLEVNLIINDILQAEYSREIEEYSDKEKAEMIIHYAIYDTYADF